MTNEGGQAEQTVKHPIIAEELSGHNVFKLGHGEGKTVRVDDTRFIWKTRGENTGCQFAVYEMDLDPDFSLPPHKHPYAEFFYVIGGRVDFGLLGADGGPEWIQAAAGESVTAPINAPHAFRNGTAGPSRFLNVSVHYHEILFDEAGTEMSPDDPMPAEPDPAKMARFNEISARLQGYGVELGAYDKSS